MYMIRLLVQLIKLIQPNANKLPEGQEHHIEVGKTLEPPVIFQFLYIIFAYIINIDMRCDIPVMLRFIHKVHKGFGDYLIDVLE